MKKIFIVLMMILCAGCTPINKNEIVVAGTVNEEDYSADLTKGILEAPFNVSCEDSLSEISLVLKDKDENIVLENTVTNESILDKNEIGIKTEMNNGQLEVTLLVNNVEKSTFIDEPFVALIAKGYQGKSSDENVEMSFDLLQYLERHIVSGEETEILEFTVNTSGQVYRLFVCAS